MGYAYEMRNGEQKSGLLDLSAFVKNIIGDKIKIVEIGVYCGSGTEIFVMTLPNCNITCVDPWRKYIEDCSMPYDLNKQEIELSEAENIFDKKFTNRINVCKKKMSSVEYASECENFSVDLVYIDGNHQYSSVLEDLQVWKEKVRSPGILAGHDFHWPSVNSALLEIMKKSPDRVFVDGSWAYVL